MAARPSVPSLTTLTCVVLVYVQLTTQVTPPPCNPGDNLYAPVFADSEVQKTIPETLPIASSVATLSASDNDTLCNFGSLTYSIIGDGSAATYFQIEKDTGTVSLKTSLTNTSVVDFTVRVAAQDGSSPPWSATALLYLKVTRNFERPVWGSAAYATSILESAPVLENILRVTATDNDAQPPNNEVTYELIGDAVQLFYFEIVSSTGDIRPRRPLTLDTNRRSLFDFVVIARDKGSPPLTAASNASVTISVFRNNNAPRFIQDPYSITVSQGLGSGAFISVRAVDNDPSTEFNQITYSIEGPANALALFTIDGSGNIQPTNPAAINSASETNYKIYLRAEDNGSPRLYDIALVELTINRNLNPPIFNPVTYQQFVLESQPTGDIVLRVAASDADTLAPNNQITYVISEGPGHLECFTINPDTGDITARRSLLFNPCTASVYSMQVIARDRGSPALDSTAATLTINVQRNDNSPIFTNEPYVTSLREDASINDPVFTVNAVDSDIVTPFNVIRFSLIGDDTAPVYFDINQTDNNNAQIFVKAPVLNDDKTTYIVRVVVSDGGEPALTDTSVVRVFVNRNLASPVFNQVQYTARILENQLVGLGLVPVTCTDADNFAPYNQVRYALAGNSTVLQFFQVNTVNNVGTVSLKRAIYDYPDSTVTQLQFQVTCEDLGNPSQAAINSATVFVTIVKNTPPFFDGIPYSTVIPATQAAGTPVFQVAARDNDVDTPFNEISLSLLGDSKTPSYFTLSQTGLISVRNGVNLTTDTRTNYVARIQVRDGGTPSLTSTALVAISVTRNFFAPVFSNSRVQETIPETTPVGTTVTTVAASDRDTVAPNGNFEYRLVGGTGIGFFYVDPNNGQVVLLKSVEGLSIQRFFTLNVEARDEGTPSLFATAIVEVSVSFDPDQLVFSAGEYNLTINENTQVNTVITQVQAQPQAGVVYTVTGLSSGPDFFSVDGSTGQVRVKTDLTSDAAELTGYRLRVRATRTGVTSQTAFTTVNIIVIRNINAPVFDRAQYLITIPDTTQLGSVLDTVRATDADGDVIEYTLTTGQPASDFFFVGPRDGSITLKTTLIGTTQNVYQFTVIARDGMTPERSSTASVIINVQGDNQPPTFISEPYATQINFTVPVGTRVFTVQGIDPDRIGQMNYELTGQYLAAPAFFRVDRTSGEVFLSSSIRTESTSTYTLGLSTFDSARPNRRDFTNLTITVNQNPNAPAFTAFSYDRTIPETYDLGLSVIQIEASDPDGQTLSYTIEAATPTNCDSYFLLGTSGLIVASRALTTSTFPLCTLNVRIRDNGVPVRQSAGLATATIIIDRNNNAPVIGGGPYTRTIPETESIGSTIFQFQASDADRPNTDFSRLEYSLIGDDSTGNFFEINSQTGVFTVRSQLDRNDIDRYVARVVVKDGGSPSKSATVTGIVNILRNLNGPVFNPTFYNATIFETQALRDSVVRVAATDADRAAPYNTVQFEVNNLLSSAPGRLYFMVDRNTGVVSLRCFLDLDTNYTGMYTVVIDAVDGGGRRANPPATVEITVDRNTTLRLPNDTSTMSPRASLCCQEPLLPYWGGSSKTYTT